MKLNQISKKLLFISLSITIIFGTIPTSIFAAEETAQLPSDLKNCHMIHDETCGYQEAKAGQECNHIHNESCGEENSECTHEHGQDCGFTEAIVGSPCTHTCELEEIENKNTTERNTAEANTEIKNVCSGLEESNTLLNSLLRLLEKQQEQGNPDEKKAEVDNLYAHVDSCETCMAQMEQSGAYYERFYGTQTLETGYSFDATTGTLTITTNEATTTWSEDTTIDTTKVTMVELTDGVTSIGEYAFSACSSLTQVTIPAEVITIGDSAFNGSNWDSIPNVTVQLLDNNDVQVGTDVSVTMTAISGKDKEYTGTASIDLGGLDVGTYSIVATAFVDDKTVTGKLEEIQITKAAHTALVKTIGVQNGAVREGTVTMEDIFGKDNVPKDAMFSKNGGALDSTKYVKFQRKGKKCAWSICK